jgi:protein-S-isoprenylcysteine O-methyltransferase Ste14
LAVEFGTHYFLLAVGVVCLAVAGKLRAMLHRHITTKVLMGLPELDPEGHPSQLVTQGLYAKVRHPRYVQIALALLGYAVFTNYLVVYAVFLVWLPVMYVIVVLEERELCGRFGKEYEEYRRRVPRFVPRLGLLKTDLARFS